LVEPLLERELDDLLLPAELRLEPDFEAERLPVPLRELALFVLLELLRREAAADLPELPVPERLTEPSTLRPSAARLTVFSRSVCREAPFEFERVVVLSRLRPSSVLVTVPDDSAVRVPPLGPVVSLERLRSMPFSVLVTVPDDSVVRVPPLGPVVSLERVRSMPSSVLVTVPELLWVVV